MLPRIKISYLNGQLGTVGESPDGLFALVWGYGRRRHVRAGESVQLEGHGRPRGIGHNVGRQSEALQARQGILRRGGGGHGACGVWRGQEREDDRAA